MESFEGFGLGIGNKSCLNEYIKIYENKVKVIVWPLTKDFHSMTVQTSPQKPLVEL